MNSPEPTDRRASLEKLRRLRELQGQLAAREHVRLAGLREELLEKCPHPLALAQYLEPLTVATPAMETLSRAWVETLGKHDGRLVMSTPGQQGKTRLSRFAIFWALLQEPSRRVMYASYGVDLARESGREVRTLVASYGAAFGLTLDRSATDATNWSLDRLPGQPHAGRMLAISPDSKATGLPSDLMVIDDIYSGEAEAHSPATLRKVEVWWESTARIRMKPGAPAVAIGTRFGENDLLGRFDAEGWPRINVPALADGETLDSVADVPGARTANGYLVSTRGTTEDDWRTIRRESGERAWASLFQGRPAPLEGGIFKREWFENARVGVAPELTQIVIGVDPAETGTGDEAGILVAGSAADGQLYLLADLSGQLSQAQWARRICLGSLRYEAQRVVAERTLGMNSAIADAWELVRRQASALLSVEVGDRVVGALQRLREAQDDRAADEPGLREVDEVAELVAGMPSTGPRVQVVTAKANKRVRAEAVTSLFEMGRAHIVGQLPILEHQAATWIEGMRSPNRIDVMAHVLAHLDAHRGRPATMSRPRATRVPSATVGPYRR